MRGEVNSPMQFLKAQIKISCVLTTAKEMTHDVLPDQSRNLESRQLSLEKINTQNKGNDFDAERKRLT